MGGMHRVAPRHPWRRGAQALALLLVVLSSACGQTTAQAVLDALRAALAAGRITLERIAQSVRRILTLKIAYGLLPIPGAVLAGPHVTSA